MSATPNLEKEKIITLEYPRKDYENLTAIDQNTNDILFKGLENEMRCLLKDKKIRGFRRGLKTDARKNVTLTLAAYYQ